MATKLKIEKRGDEIKKIPLLGNYWANLNTEATEILSKENTKMYNFSF